MEGENRTRFQVCNHPVGDILSSSSDSELPFITADHNTLITELRREPNDLILTKLGDWAAGLIYVPSLRDIVTIGELNANIRLLDRSSIPAFINKIKSNQPPLFKEFEDLLTRLIPGIKRVYPHLEDDPTQVSVRISEKDVSNTVQAHRLDTVGSGVKEIIYIAAMIWLSPEGSTVLIEEPERGLHPHSQRLLVRQAIQHANEHSKQLFWATHSSVIASLTPDSTVHLVTLPEEQGTITTHIDKTTRGVVRRAIGQSNLDIYNSDVTVFFDGPTEEAVLPEIIEHFINPSQFPALQFYPFYPLNGDIRSRQDELVSLLKLLVANNSRAFVFADDENNAYRVKTDLLRLFRSSNNAPQIHIWDCGVRDRLAGARGAEFEDNFSLVELASAANRLGGGRKLKSAELNKRVTENPRKMPSKVLATYYHEVGYEDWSKVKLGALLGKTGLAKIQTSKRRGYDNRGYEFESVIVADLLPLIPES